MAADSQFNNEVIWARTQYWYDWVLLSPSGPRRCECVLAGLEHGHNTAQATDPSVVSFKQMTMLFVNNLVLDRSSASVRSMQLKTEAESLISIQESTALGGGSLEELMYTPVQGRQTLRCDHDFTCQVNTPHDDPDEPGHSLYTRKSSLHDRPSHSQSPTCSVASPHSSSAAPIQ